MTEIKKWATHFFSNQVSIYPLVTFRIIFGLMMCYSTLRFINKGWVTDLYVTPKFYFTYYGFDWIKPLNEEGMYFLFYLMVALSIFIAFGLFYRFSAISFFIIFTNHFLPFDPLKPSISNSISSSLLQLYSGSLGEMTVLKVN